MTIFDDSVLPAPDSPEMMIDWLVPSTFIERKARSAIANRWGGSTPIDLPR